MGVNSLYSNTIGSGNNAIGYYSLYSNTTGDGNNANGHYSLRNNTTGNNNNANGYYSLGNNTTGDNNNANGYFSLYSNTTGINNNANGTNSLYSNTTGFSNNASGYYSLLNNTTGDNNSANGYYSGAHITGGAFPNTQTDNSVYLGANTKAQADSQTNQIVIGYDATGLGSNSAILGNSSISLTALRGSVLVNTTTNISSSQLTVESVSKGFLPPRMTTTQKNAIGSPTAGLLVYDLTLNKMCVYSTQWDTISTQRITFGTGVQTALGVNIGSAGAPVLFNGALGTPSSGTLTNATGLPQSGVTNLTTDLGLKAPLANPTFTGTVTIPTPFTLGATSVTSTGTQLNYLSSATGTTGTTSTNLVFSTSPTLTTPVLGVASATSMNVGGGTLNGVVNALSTTDITLASTAHALTIGGASSSTNLVGGEYSTGVGLQARNNGAIGVLFLNPLGGDTRVGATAPAGASNFTLFHVGTGTGDYAEISGRNGAGAAADGLLHRTFGTSWTTSGSNFQDGGASMTGTNLSGGYSIGTQASADLRFYSNNTLRTTIQAGGNTIHTARVQLSKGANVASAGDLTLGSAGNAFSITGTTTINAITTTNWQAGSVIILIFASTPTVKHNTAGGAGTAKMLLNGGVNFVASANDVLTLIYDGTNWLECSRSIN